jgi:hypothetical protein
MIEINWTGVAHNFRNDLNGSIVDWTKVVLMRTTINVVSLTKEIKSKTLTNSFILEVLETINATSGRLVLMMHFVRTRPS